MAYPGAFRRRYAGLGVQTRCPNERGTDAKQKLFNHIFNASASTRSQTFKTLKNGEFDLVRVWVCNSGLCRCITIYRLYQWSQHFRSTGVPKVGPGYGSECTGDWMISHQPLSFNNMHNNIIYHLLEFGLDYDCRVKPWKRSPRTLPSPLKKSDFSVSLQNIKVFHP